MEVPGNMNHATPAMQVEKQLIHPLGRKRIVPTVMELERSIIDVRSVTEKAISMISEGTM